MFFSHVVVGIIFMGVASAKPQRPGPRSNWEAPRRIKTSLAPRRFEDVSNTTTAVRASWDVSNSLIWVDADLGTPPQRVELALDLSGDFTWVNPTCSNSIDPTGCDRRGQYVPANSQTRQRVVADDPILHDDDWTGHISSAYSDKMNLPSTDNWNREVRYTFGVASSSTGWAYGVLGLGTSSRSNNSVSVINVWASNSGYDRRVFILGNRMYENGEATAEHMGPSLQMIDNGAFAGTLEKLPIVMPGEHGVKNLGFNVELDGMKLWSFETGEYTEFDAQLPEAIQIGSGLFTSLPSDVATEIFKHLGATQSGDDDELHYVECPTGESDMFLTFIFKSQKIHVGLWTFLIPLSSGTSCVVAIKPTTEVPILGAAFAKAAFMAFDLDRGEVHVAQLTSCDRQGFFVVKEQTDEIPADLSGCPCCWCEDADECGGNTSTSTTTSTRVTTRISTSSFSATSSSVTITSSATTTSSESSSSQTVTVPVCTRCSSTESSSESTTSTSSFSSETTSTTSSIETTTTSTTSFETTSSQCSSCSSETTSSSVSSTETTPHCTTCSTTKSSTIQTPTTSLVTTSSVTTLSSTPRGTSSTSFSTSANITSSKTTLTETITEHITTVVTSCPATTTKCSVGQTLTVVITRTTTWCPSDSTTAKTSHPATGTHTEGCTAGCKPPSSAVSSLTTVTTITRNCPTCAATPAAGSSSAVAAGPGSGAGSGSGSQSGAGSGPESGTGAGKPGSGAGAAGSAAVGSGKTNGTATATAAAKPVTAGANNMSVGVGVWIFTLLGGALVLLQAV